MCLPQLCLTFVKHDAGSSTGRHLEVGEHALHGLGGIGRRGQVAALGRQQYDGDVGSE